ncbi:MAG: transcription antitermination factor NusB [Chloroflexi bacterium]|nr:transcription antitermination factor NusB [Chloroflexota bacterium]
MFTDDYRRQARGLALQALYELDCTHHTLGDVLTERLSAEAWQDQTRALADQLVRGILEHREKLDALIHHYAPEWPLDQIAIIDRNILRIAIFELASDNNVPVKVAISEAIILAKTFGTESTPRFINGVLGTLVSRETELHSILNTISVTNHHD